MQHEYALMVNGLPSKQRIWVRFPLFVMMKKIISFIEEQTSLFTRYIRYNLEVAFYTKLADYYSFLIVIFVFVYVMYMLFVIIQIIFSYCYNFYCCYFYRCWEITTFLEEITIFLEEKIKQNFCSF